MLADITDFALGCAVRIIDSKLKELDVMLYCFAEMSDSPLISSSILLATVVVVVVVVDVIVESNSN